ncbi:unnamed protein product [Vitrella brassicaformis CCMP3155]|uniref:Uncharacterized protein n=2 Tax=Vitrella brassicaformis TaxID=1169539 RepID=A0A0G4GQF7_VITBC|nr:unnamed protein product [Vitrella brassicaformis CCMP3155]|eukprot:CEM32693.1 unnamed protein product [Vitrella brassicaformis CCMP3155]
MSEEGRDEPRPAREGGIHRKRHRPPQDNPSDGQHLREAAVGNDGNENDGAQAPAGAKNTTRDPSNFRNTPKQSSVPQRKELRCNRPPDYVPPKRHRRDDATQTQQADGRDDEVHHMESSEPAAPAAAAAAAAAVPAAPAVARPPLPPSHRGAVKSSLAGAGGVAVGAIKPWGVQTPLHKIHQGKPTGQNLPLPRAKPNRGSSGIPKIMDDRPVLGDTRQLTDRADTDEGRQRQRQWQQQREGAGGGGVGLGVEDGVLGEDGAGDGGEGERRKARRVMQHDQSKAKSVEIATGAAAAAAAAAVRVDRAKPPAKTPPSAQRERRKTLLPSEARQQQQQRNIQTDIDRLSPVPSPSPPPSPTVRVVTLNTLLQPPWGGFFTTPLKAPHVLAPKDGKAKSSRKRVPPAYYEMFDVPTIGDPPLGAYEVLFCSHPERLGLEIQLECGSGWMAPPSHAPEEEKEWGRPLTPHRRLPRHSVLNPDKDKEARSLSQILMPPPDPIPPTITPYRRPLTPPLPPQPKSRAPSAFPMPFNPSPGMWVAPMMNRSPLERPLTPNRGLGWEGEEGQEGEEQVKDMVNHLITQVEEQQQHQQQQHAMDFSPAAPRPISPPPPRKARLGVSKMLEETRKRLEREGQGQNGQGSGGGGGFDFLRGVSPVFVRPRPMSAGPAPTSGVFECVGEVGGLRAPENSPHVGVSGGSDSDGMDLVPPSPRPMARRPRKSTGNLMDIYNDPEFLAAQKEILNNDSTSEERKVYEIAMAAGRRQLELEGGTEDEKQQTAALLDILDNAYLDALEEAERDRPEQILVFDDKPGTGKKQLSPLEQKEAELDLEIAILREKLRKGEDAMMEWRAAIQEYEQATVPEPSQGVEEPAAAAAAGAAEGPDVLQLPTAEQWRSLMDKFVLYEMMANANLLEVHKLGKLQEELARAMAAETYQDIPYAHSPGRLIFNFQRVGGGGRLSIGGSPSPAMSPHCGFRFSPSPSPQVPAPAATRTRLNPMTDIKEGVAAAAVDG